MSKEIKGKKEFRNVYFSYPSKPNELILKIYLSQEILERGYE